MKKMLLIALMTLTNLLQAGEIKIYEVYPENFFEFERVESEFKFNKDSLESTVSVRLQPSYYSPSMPKETEINLPNVEFDQVTGNIFLILGKKKFRCARVKKRPDGSYSNIVINDQCRFENRFRTIESRSSLTSNIQIMEVFLIY